MRTRFAPSPTGELHLGGLRTALYSYLLARSPRQSNGKFFLRIEDTDASRTVPGAADRIVQVMDRVGLERDGPLVQQSTRLDMYRKQAEYLVQTNKAYKCFCSKERLETLRATQQSMSQPTRYDGKCSHMSALEASQRAAAGEPYVIRMKAKLTGETTVHDEIAGQVKFSNAVALDDQVLIKQDGWPTYHLAAVVDDHEMGITHVVRGDEWLSSTPKHLSLYNMFGWAPPKFAHLPLLLTPDGKKLSKRSPMGQSVESLLNKGYLPSAMLNFVFLLGWGAHAASGSSSSSVVFYDKKELAAQFELDKVTRGGAIVDEDRLVWLNSMHIRHAVAENDYGELRAEVEKELRGMEQFSQERLDKVIHLLKERARFPMDFVNLGKHFFASSVSLEPIPNEVLDDKFSLDVLEKTANLFRSSKERPTVAVMEDLPKTFGIRKRSVLTPLRWAITGQLVGAPVSETVQILEIDEVLKRLEAAKSVLKKRLNK